MKVHNEHLSKRDQQTVAEEAAAERAFQAERSRAGAIPSKEGPAAVGGSPAREDAREVLPLAPVGAKILRHVKVGPVDHYYVIGLAPPYAGAALWMDILPTVKDVTAEFDRRLRRA